MSEPHRAECRRAQWASVVVAAALFSFSSTAWSQGRRGTRPPPPTAKSAPDADDSSPAPVRTEPEMAPPADPTSVPPDLRARLGSDYARGPASPTGPLSDRSFYPYYEEHRGDYRLRLLPPLFVEQTRGLSDPSQNRYGIPSSEDTEGLYGFVYYRRRSRQTSMDVVFPAFWRVRDGDSHTLVLGPLAHRESPGENDNWLAPLYFHGMRARGGYFHAPLLLTTSQWSPEGAFTLVGPYFRARSGSDVSFGLAPLFFHGDNGNIEGNRRAYTLVPPLLYFHNEHEIDGGATTVAGPLLLQSDTKREVTDVLPLFYHIHGKPESGGVYEEHTTLFPFFHYGHDPSKTLFILPGYFRRVSPNSDALITLFYSHAVGRGGATTLTAAGPIVPLVWDYRDRDLGAHSWAVAPLVVSSTSPLGNAWLTPLIGRFENYGDSRTWWIFPTLTLGTNTHGWETDFHPIVYIGRSDDSAHTVIAPIFWDFASSKGRTTVGFPVYWRFAEGPNDSVVQVAANTLYTQKRVAGGLDWEFHLLPLFSYGESPGGYFWNVLFGLAGYSRTPEGTRMRALWIPIPLSGAAQASGSAAFPAAR